MKSIVGFAMLLLCTTVACQPRITQHGRLLAIETGTVRREIRTSSTTPGVIESRIFKAATNELILSNGNTPWFSLRVDGKDRTSADPIWLLRHHAERRMKNGGMEFTITWICTTPDLEGLVLSAVIQTYRGDEFFRERLVLSADWGRRIISHISLNDLIVSSAPSPSLPRRQTASRPKNFGLPPGMES